MWSAVHFIALLSKNIWTLMQRNFKLKIENSFSNKFLYCYLRGIALNFGKKLTLVLEFLYLSDWQW